MTKKTVRDIDVAGKRVLVRVDFNVPQDKTSGAIDDDSRIRAALPTIDYLRDHQAKTILVSHLGRPDGKVVEKLRLKPVAARLQELLGAPVAYATDCIGPEAEGAVARLQPGDVLLLENVRFHPEEETNDPEFAHKLAALADLYVDDAFGTAHRTHASTEGVAHDLPAVAGLLMERELDFLGRANQNPQRPYAAIIGGAKVSDKIAVLRRLVETVDKLLIGGGMANTFLAARGYQLGASLVEQDQLDVANEVTQRAAQRRISLLLPEDLAVAERFAADAGREVLDLPERTDNPHTVLEDGMMALDIGPKTVATFTAALQGCKLIVWNGPLGVFEFPNFALGTMLIADAVAKTGATTIVGGGETVAAIHRAGVADRISHISTGGGASLEFLEGKTLPGVAVLQDK
ncbi:MAG TPA: phosphoglycerate kinase [Dehalococcoidia bacterium]|nr:phosphoglycerate kinase [Dehalococcoidia bacterium]